MEDFAKRFDSYYNALVSQHCYLNQEGCKPTGSDLSKFLDSNQAANLSSTSVLAEKLNQSQQKSGFQAEN